MVLENCQICLQAPTKLYFFVQVDLGIEYNRYLREVVETLEKDDAFKKKLETADEADIRVCIVFYFYVK